MPPDRRLGDHRGHPPTDPILDHAQRVRAGLVGQGDPPGDLHWAWRRDGQDRGRSAPRGAGRARSSGVLDRQELGDWIRSAVRRNSRHDPLGTVDAVRGLMTLPPRTRANSSSVLLATGQHPPGRRGRHRSPRRRRAHRDRAAAWSSSSATRSTYRGNLAAAAAASVPSAMSRAATLRSDRSGVLAHFRTVLAQPAVHQADQRVRLLVSDDRAALDPLWAVSSRRSRGSVSASRRRAAGAATPRRGRGSRAGGSAVLLGTPSESAHVAPDEEQEGAAGGRRGLCPRSRNQSSSPTAPDPGAATSAEGHAGHRDDVTGLVGADRRLDRHGGPRWRSRCSRLVDEDGDATSESACPARGRSSRSSGWEL